MKRGLKKAERGWVKEVMEKGRRDDQKAWKGDTSRVGKCWGRGLGNDKGIEESWGED